MRFVSSRPPVPASTPNQLFFYKWKLIKPKKTKTKTYNKDTVPSHSSVNRSSLPKRITNLLTALRINRHQCLLWSTSTNTQRQSPIRALREPQLGPRFGGNELSTGHRGRVINFRPRVARKRLEPGRRGDRFEVVVVGEVDWTSVVVEVSQGRVLSLRLAVGVSNEWRIVAEEVFELRRRMLLDLRIEKGGENCWIGNALCCDFLSLIFPNCDEEIEISSMARIMNQSITWTQ